MNLRPASDPADLRRAAELRLKERTTSSAPQTEAELLRLQHELQVHQIELEMQNQELCAARVEIEASLKRHTELFDFAPVCYLNLAPDGTIVDVNLAGVNLLGICRDRLLGTNFGRLLGQNDQLTLTEILAKIFSTGARISADLTVLMDDGSTLFVRFKVSASQDGKHCFVVLVDLTERKRNEEQLRLSDGLLKTVEKDLLRQQKILERIAEVAPLNEVLNDLVAIIEAELTSVSCSFLLLDPDGVHLHVGSGGKLPKSYNEAIEGISIGPQVGSCGTAVFRGESVFVADIASDPLWINFRDLALSNGLRACWSVPIRSRRSGVNKVLGTFAVYSSEVGLPDERLNTLISRIEYLACIAIENSQTTQSLHVSEARFRRFVENTPDAFFLHQLDGTIIDVNDRACEQLGYSREELIGLTPYAFDFELKPEKMESLFTLLNQGQRPIFEAQHRCKDGTVIPVEVHLSPVGTAGELQVLSTVRDVSARKHIEEELRAKHELLEETQELAHLGSFEWDVQTNHLTWSDELYRIYGYSPQEIEPSMETFFGHLHPDDRSSVQAKIHQACLDGSTFSMEERILRRDGSIRTLDSRGRVICDDSGQPARIIGACIDITERKRFETERNRLENQFLQSQKMDAVGKLAGGVAHDFNNLLTIIIGYGNLIFTEMPADAPHREAIEAILDACERAARLTQQLLAFSRSVVVEMKTIDLNLFVEKMAQMLRRLIEEDISLTLTLAPKVSPIKAPPGQLEQLIMNMVVNARDAMPSGGQLQIKTRNFTLENADLVTYPDLTAGEYVELSIADTGVGMKDEITNKIFEPFFTTKEVGKGTGLGLSVVHGVVKQCGGGISLESKVGIGTTFRILFPAQTDAAKSAEPSTSPRSFKGHETILVVEDEIAVCKIVKTGLEANGYKVLHANGGQEAIQLAANFPGIIDLLLTDVVMPEMSGQKVADAIKLQRPGIRVIYMSGYANEVVFRRGVTDTTDEFLQKPFTTIGLTRKVRSVLAAIAR